MGEGDPTKEAGIPFDVREAAEYIHGTPTVCVLNLTGGGAHALPWLLAVPGASATVLSASVPYSTDALRSLLSPLRQPPRSACSAATASALAAVAYQAAVRQAPSGAPVVGIGATCAIRTVRALRGSHRAHVCARTDHAEVQYHMQFDKLAERSRLQEDVLASRLVIQALLDSCSPPLPHITSSTMSLLRGKLTSTHDILPKPVVREQQHAIDALFAACSRTEEEPLEVITEDLALSDVDTAPRVAQMDPNGSWRLGAVSATALLPGSFNPVHHGHRRLLHAAKAFLEPDAVVGFELCMLNPDKPPLSPAKVRSRAEQFISTNPNGDDSDAPLVVTTEPLFVGKAALLPGTTFIVGFDTAIRIVNPVYYGGESGMVQALISIASNQCRFLVAGRRETPTSGDFLTLDNVKVPPGFESLFQAIPESLFREDVSSTQIRDRIAASKEE